MNLSQYLKNQGITTGPLGKLKNTSHSGLDVILKFLTNREQFKGGEGFLTFGSATHERCLINISTTFNKLTGAEKFQVQRMEGKFKSHPVVKRLVEGAVNEKKKKTYLNGVRFAYILDIHQPKRKSGSDLKTTACSTFQEFLESAIDYGYFRQGESYKAAESLLEFIFIGIQKVAPHNIFILDVSLYPEECKYALEELEFLLYFFQNYGKALIGGVDRRSKIMVEIQDESRLYTGVLLEFDKLGKDKDVLIKGVLRGQVKFKKQPPPIQKKFKK